MQRPKFSDDAGSASLEFITAGVLLLVPLVYLVLAISSVQSATFAVEGSARQAARVFVTSETTDQAYGRADQAITFGLSDYGLQRDRANVSVDCLSASCLEPDSLVRVNVTVNVPLPLVPPVLGLQQLASVPVTSSSTAHVSRFHGGV